MIAAGVVAAALVLLIVLAALGAPGIVVTILAFMVALTGALTWEAARRRQWEKETTHQLRKLSDYHDRLVRESARTRSDVSTLKEGPV